MKWAARKCGPFASGCFCGYYLPCITVNELILPNALLEEMLEYLEMCLPEEACGLIGGFVADGRGHAVRLFPIENILHSPVAYEMDPLQQIQTMIAIENAGMELTAIYHSHPSGPSYPSRTDIAQAYYPDTASVIVSMAHPQRPSVRAFVIADGEIKEMPVTEGP